MTKLKIMAAGCFLFATAPAYASTCIGVCGASGPDGVVTAPPGGSTYQYVTTANGANGAGQIGGVGGTNGSEFISDPFTAAAGDALNFSFNYVTSDGAGFSDYAFAELLTAAGASVGYLFTARTTTSGNTSPGFGLPANIATLTPGATPINPEATTWSPLGDDSGLCFNDGCGNTGWIRSTYTLGSSGSYQVRFGVANFDDDLYQSGLAFAGLAVNDVPIGGAVPEPATWAMMILGFGAVGGAMRRRAPARILRTA